MTNYCEVELKNLTPIECGDDTECDVSNCFYQRYIEFVRDLHLDTILDQWDTEDAERHLNCCNELLDWSNNLLETNNKLQEHIINDTTWNFYAKLYEAQYNLENLRYLLIDLKKTLKALHSMTKSVIDAKRQCPYWIENDD